MNRIVPSGVMDDATVQVSVDIDQLDDTVSMVW